jgi:peptidoglycan/LPS O-acetylase OafA/YrhL
MQADAEVVWGRSVLNLLFGAAVLAAPRARWLAARPLRAVGRVSYGMYVFHLPAIRLLTAVWAAEPWSLEGLFQFGLYLGGVWAAAELSFRFFEAPISRWARERPAEALETATPPLA